MVFFLYIFLVMLFSNSLTRVCLHRKSDMKMTRFVTCRRALQTKTKSNVIDRKNDIQPDL